jgi:hypothetical protein
MVEKVKDLIATDARFTTRYIAKCVGNSVGAAHTILRHGLRMRLISASWVPHRLASPYKRVKTCSGKNLLTIVETNP